jgi:Spo0E like sporulation regulatory protein
MTILEFLIEKKRKEMIALAKKYGLMAPEIVKVSKELDQLIIIYQKSVKTISFKLEKI